MIHLRYSAGFWICFDFRIYQIWEYIRVLKCARVTQGFEWDVSWQHSENGLDPEYARVLNMLGLHKILNKILHHRYFKGVWICFELWICRCYIGLYRKRQQKSKYDKVTKGSEWNALLHRTYLTGFWIYHGSKYVRILNILGYIR